MLATTTVECLDHYLENEVSFVCHINLTSFYFYIINDLSIGITWLIATVGCGGKIENRYFESSRIGGEGVGIGFNQSFIHMPPYPPTLILFFIVFYLPLFDSNQNTILWSKTDCCKAFAPPPLVTTILLSTTKITDHHHNMRRCVITLRLPFPRSLPGII